MSIDPSTELIKYEQQSLFLPSGECTAILLHPRTLEKLAGSSYTPQEILDFITGIRPRDDGRYVLLIALGAGEQYGCFTEENLVRTERGYISIKDVRKGDKVWAREAFREVLTTFEYKHHAHGVRIKVGGLIDPIVCTEAHRFFSVGQEEIRCSRDKYIRCVPDTAGSNSICHRKSAQEQCCVAAAAAIAVKLKPANTLALKDYLVCALPRHDQPARMSAREARVAGLWLAEGCFIHQRSRFSMSSGLMFSFGVKETKLTETVIDYAAAAGYVLHGPYPGHGKCVSIRVMDSVLAFKYKDWFGEYAAHKKLPVWLESQPEEVILELLAGYFDGDGTVSTKGRVTAHTASKELALGIQRLLWSVHIPSTVCPVNTPGHFRVDFTTDRGERLFAKMCKYEVRERKGRAHHQQFFFDNYVALPIRKIECVSLTGQKTYDIEVEEEHSYNVGQVACHNSNRNADYFPEWSLKGDPPPPDVMDLVRRKGLPVPQEYGYKTFERYAFPFRGHNNGDPIHAIGERVCCAAYNEKMHRVELVIFIYTHKAPDVVEALDAGRPVAFSMGAKLLWDFSSCCGNVARSKAEYCECLKTKGGQILPDGRKVFTYNYFPRFFDISEIVVPADRSAYSLRKVAGLGMGDLPAKEGTLEMSGMAKIAGLLDYLSAGGKTASIEKEIPGEKPAINLGKEPIAPEIWNLLRERAISDKETAPEIAPGEMDCLRQHPLDKILSLLTALGVLLRPSEVHGLTGGDEMKMPERLDFSSISPKLVTGLKGIAEKRSLFEPVFSIRVRRITLAKPAAGEKKAREKTPAYEKYLDLLRHGTDVEALKEAMVHPQICSLLNQDCLEKEIIGLGGGVDPDKAMLPFLLALDAHDREG